jgi:4'-phosphopantetheinyl transferase
MSSRALLLRCASVHTGTDCSGAAVAHTPAGKPYFPELPALHFSVSHSGDWWACAMGDAPVGLDLQIHGGRYDLAAISRRFFALEEDAWLRETAYQDFFTLWAAKESYAKFTGRGMDEALLAMSMVRGGRLAGTLPGAALHILPAPAGYTLCLCAEHVGDVGTVELQPLIF